MTLCNHDECRLQEGHDGDHAAYPVQAWGFMELKDKNKLNKAGYATPRGGDKGAYQNHVYRNNRVIVPYERLAVTELEHFEDGYVIRLYPDQYFAAPNEVHPQFNADQAWIVPGTNAFILYRTHNSLDEFPPPDNWSVRGLEKDGAPRTRRGLGVIDTGHYVKRVSKQGQREECNEGPPQGIFAPEYANSKTNYLSQCVLAWLIVRTVDSPYTTTQATWLKEILDSEGLAVENELVDIGAIRHGVSACPLCGKLLRYEQFHEMIDLVDEDALENAATQVAGSTRSTAINLFHISPLIYAEARHKPGLVAWGHATCNTKLGQRHCYSLKELQQTGLKVATIDGETIDTFGWISNNYEMIRSPNGAVWIRICTDDADGPENHDITITEE